MRRPADHQLDDVRAELHAIIDRLIAAWPHLDHQARDMGRGYPSAGNGPRSRGDISRPVERLALDDQDDPSTTAHAALLELQALIHRAKFLDARVRGLLPDHTTHDTHGPKCESCGTHGKPGSFKADRWCNACYKRILRHRDNATTP
jgi:hypothetical protein